MKWTNETFLRLYSRITAEWLLLPVSARGLFDELLKYASDDGRVSFLGASAGVGIARVVSAHPSETRRIEADVAALVRDGCVFVDGSALVIKNFPAAQGIVPMSREERSEERSAAAIRAAKWRAARADGQNSAPENGSDSVRERSANAFANATPNDVRERSANSSPRAGARATRPFLPSSEKEEEKKTANANGQNEPPKHDALVVALRAEPLLAEANHAGIATELHSHGMSAGISEARWLACIAFGLECLRAKSLERHVENPVGYLRKVVKNNAPRGALEQSIKDRDAPTARSNAPLAKPKERPALGPDGDFDEEPPFDHEKFLRLRAERKSAR